GEGAGLLRFEGEVDLLDERLADLALDGVEIDGRQRALHRAKEEGHELQVEGERGLDARAADLHGDLPAVVELGLVDLADARGRAGRLFEAGEAILERAAELGLERAADDGVGELGRLVLEG